MLNKWGGELEVSSLNLERTQYYRSPKEIPKYNNYITPPPPLFRCAHSLKHKNFSSSMYDSQVVSSGSTSWHVYIPVPGGSKCVLELYIQ